MTVDRVGNMDERVGEGHEKKQSLAGLEPGLPSYMGYALITRPSTPPKTDLYSSHNVRRTAPTATAKLVKRMITIKLQQSLLKNSWNLLKKYKINTCFNVLLNSL